MSEAAKTKLRMKQTVFIVDDDPSICEGLANLLESVSISTCSYPSAEAFKEGWGPEDAGCVLLDVRLPGITGVEFQEQMRSIGIDLPIIFMTAHGDIPMVRKVMRAGAVEFLTKPFQKKELLHAVDEAFALDFARRQEVENLREIRARIDSLSPREREVMAMVTAGMLNKQIAADLNLSEITVKLHRRQVMEKMQAGSLAELVKMCERVKAPLRVVRPYATPPQGADSSDEP